MSRLISSCLWVLASGFFLLVAGTLAAEYYAPATWWSWGHQAQVLGENVVVDSEDEPAEASGEPTLAQTADARAALVANFIERNDAGKNSPLQPYDYWGRFFVEVADENGLDFRLLPAIARKESTFCKSNIAQKYYNCFGYGVPASGITDAGKFESFEEGIRTVARALKRSYIDQGLTDPVAIMSKYCPPSAEGDGSWSRNINQWLAEMRYDDKSAIYDAVQNADLTEFIGQNASASAQEN